MTRAFGHEKLSNLIRESQSWVPYHETGQDLVHVAAYYGLYDLIIDFMIPQLGYDVDFYETPHRKLTLLHTVVKYHNYPWSEKEKASVSRLISLSNNLWLRNNHNSSFLRTAKVRGHCRENLAFLSREVERQGTEKQAKIMFILTKKVGLHRDKLNKYVAREIYKYVD